MENKEIDLSKIENDCIDNIKTNFINWYDFNNKNRICIFGDIDKVVLDYLKSKIKEVELFDENIDENSKKYDYILLMNGLDDKKENEELIKNLNHFSDMLENDGKVLLLQKNILSLWNFIKETEEGIGRTRLLKIIEETCFKNYKFFYLLPEVYQTNVIFSDEFLPTINDLRRNHHFSREHNIYGTLENEFLHKFLENRPSDFKYCANTFLIELSKTEIKNDVKAVFFNNVRPEEYRLKTIIYNDKVIKEPVNELSIEHIKLIEKNIDILKQCEINVLDTCEDNKINSTVLKDCKRFDDEIIKIYYEGSEEAIRMINNFKNQVLEKLNKVNSEDTIFKKYNIEGSKKDLDKLTFVEHGLWDLTFQNAFIKDNTFYIYDQEWYEKNVPIEFILYRSILMLNTLTDGEKEDLLKRLNLFEFKELFDNLEREIQISVTNEVMCRLYQNTFVGSIEEEKEEEPIVEQTQEIEQKVELPQEKIYTKIAFRLMPKKLKRKIRTKIEYSNNLSKITGIPMMASYNVNSMKLYRGKDCDSKGVLSQITLNKTIGIHLHLYYEDLADEFYHYLSNIPYVFDLYISIRKDANRLKIKNVFNKIANLNHLEVVKSENCGRDFGPMFVLFAKKLRKYDYIMHIHSKKSLRTGAEQSAWRRYMLDNILGSRERIMKCFYLMEQENIGLVYPDTYKDVQYWVHNWLDEAPLAKNILERINIEYEDTYLEFSAGSMFWAKKEALEPILNLELTWQDFGKDVGQYGGTLEYVFERIPGVVAKHQGYDIAIYNEGQKAFLLNNGEKNLSNYYRQSLETVTNELSQFDIITFDIFDTLITRKVLYPDDVMVNLEPKVKEKYNVDDYFKMRKQAETNVRINKNFEGDCTIYEIYEEFANITNISKESANEIMEMEIQAEIDCCIPRKETLELYNNLLKMNKTIILISDMYMTSKELERILTNCGYSGYSKILVSSEIGKRKDNGTMWDYFLEEYKGQKTIHVGDNEEADIHKLLDRGKESCYLMKGKKLFDISDYSNKKKFTHKEAMAMGKIINEYMFNSPFALSTSDEKAVINDEFKYGYCLLGPIILEYFKWLIKALNNKKQEVLLFSAREGYYLQRIYKHLMQKLNKPEIENYYFYVSRRAVSVAALKEEKDLYELLEKQFVGTARDLLYNRFGIDDVSLGKAKINIYGQQKRTREIVALHKDKILENSKKERENYLKYINKTIKDIDNKNLNFLDLGYAGTAQYYLSKLLNKKIDGKYFAVYKPEKPLSIGCNVDACYNDDIKDDDTNIDNPLFKYSILLEAFLTAPQGQLLCFDDEGNPKFNEDDNKEKWEYFEKIYDAIIKYIDDTYEIFKEDILNFEFDKNICINLYKGYVYESGKLDEHMKKFFDIDDYYCSNKVINGVESCQKRL